jgi:CBS domain-containing protein
MTENPAILGADISVREAAKLMREKDIGDITVQKDGRLCGIVTDRDIVVRAVAQDKDLSSTNLESICSKDVTSLEPGDSDAHAVKLMREKSVRRLPVLEKDRVIGIVSLGDLAIDKDPKSVLGQISAAPPNT